jgi:hypothetical protein
VLLNATGLNVAAGEPNNFKVALDLALPNFPYVLDDSTKQDLNDALRLLVADALAEYDISTDEVMIEDVSGAVSTSSAEIGGGQTVTTHIVLIPADDELASVQELVQSIPEFSTLFAKVCVGRWSKGCTKVGLCEFAKLKGCGNASRTPKYEPA